MRGFRFSNRQEEVLFPALRRRKISSAFPARENRGRIEGTLLDGVRCPREDIWVRDTIECDVHGPMERTHVCIHLTDESSGLGFNHADPSEQDSLPDAWCDNCEIIPAAHTGWVGVPEGLCHMVVLCSACYVRARIRHTRPSTTLQDLSELHWKCGGCDQWHTGPMLDLAFGQPAYWRSDLPAGSRWEVLPSGAILKASKSFLDEDYCAVDDESFFVRGLIHLPILGTSETFRWGAWGSLSRENFEKLLRADSKGDRLVAPPLFS